MGDNIYLAKSFPSQRIFLSCAVVYLVLIFGLWTVYVSTVYSSIAAIANLPARTFLNEFFRTCIFVAPVFLLLKLFIGEKPISFLKLETNIKSGILLGVTAGVFYAMLVLARILLTNGDINLQPVPNQAWFTALTTATLIEEIAFRGFLLQSFERVANFWAANFLTAILFVAIHFPGWIIVGNARLIPDKMTAMTDILFLGLVLGFLFKRSQSLWACVILHATNNLLSITLFG